MPKVDFYILQNQSENQMFPFACKLLEKSYKQAHKALVLFADESNARKFDDLLWTFHDISFIPHKLVTDTEIAVVPIILTWEIKENPQQSFLINLTLDVPPCLDTFERIIEIVPQTEPWLTPSRQKYAKYREQNCELTTHKL